jgi:hypothetical protein
MSTESGILFGAPKNRTDDIFYVCSHRMIGEIERLSAFVNQLNKIGHSPLYMAVKECSLETARMLLKCGARVNAGSIDAILAAACLEPFSEKMACMLLDHGSSLDFRTGSHFPLFGRARELNVFTAGEMTCEAMHFFISRGREPCGSDIRCAAENRWYKMLDFYGHAGYLGRAFDGETPTFLEDTSVAFFMMFKAVPRVAMLQWVTEVVMGKFFGNENGVILREVMRVDESLWPDSLYEHWRAATNQTKRDFELRVHYARRDIARERWNRVVSPRAAQLCVALQPIGLAAAELVAVLTAAFPADTYSYRKWWDVAVKVKHFSV